MLCRFCKVTSKKSRRIWFARGDALNPHYDEPMGGQTASQIRALLADAGLAPQHRFGQNFLIDLNLMRKVTQVAGVCAADLILEIGPGTGSLTELLLDSGATVIAVEIDRGLQELLTRRIGHHDRFCLICGDALAGKHRVNPSVVQELLARSPQPGGGRKLVANLPYQIATPLLIDLLLVTPGFARLTCSIQKEVGERLVAAHASAAYGPVSVIMQSLADVRIAARIPPEAFWPRPGVDSVLIDVVPKPREAVEISDPARFAAFVQRVFGQRRKMLRRVTADFEPAGAERIFSDCGVSPEQRPEQLAPAQWRALHRAFCQWAPASQADAWTAPL